MKQFIFFLAFGLFCVSLFGQSTPVTINVSGENIIAYKQSYALIIGISNYTHLRKLPGVLNDVEAVSNALGNNGFTVTVKKDLNKKQIDDAINDFVRQYGQAQNNRLIIYFAGHGYTMLAAWGDELGYFVPVDAPKPSVDAASFRSKSIDMSQIEIYAKNIQSKHALFLFDACFAGTIFNINMKSSSMSAINYKTKEPVRQFITSGGANEEVPDNSIFRRQFITAITTTDADYNNDHYLTCTELGEFLQEKVINYSRETQHPQYGKIRNPYLDKGDFVFQLPGYIPRKDTPRKNQTTLTTENDSKNALDYATRVRKIIAEVLKVDISKVTPQANLIYDLGVDSRELKEIGYQFDIQFKGLYIVDIEDEFLITVGDCIKMIENYMSE